MVITHGGLGVLIAELLGAPSPRCRLPATNSADRVPAFARREAPGSTKTPRSRRTLPLLNVVAEFRYGKGRKSGAKAWQMWQANEHRCVDHGYLIEDCKRHAQGCLLVA